MLWRLTWFRFMRRWGSATGGACSTGAATASPWAGAARQDSPAGETGVASCKTTRNCLARMKKNAPPIAAAANRSKATVLPAERGRRSLVSAASDELAGELTGAPRTALIADAGAACSWLSCGGSRGACSRRSGTCSALGGSDSPVFGACAGVESVGGATKAATMGGRLASAEG